MKSLSAEDSSGRRGSPSVTRAVNRPVVVITVPVEAFGRAVPVVVGPCRLGTPWCEVVQQSPGSRVQLAGLVAAMQVLAAHEVTVHAAHHPVERCWCDAPPGGRRPRRTPGLARTA